MQVGAMNDGVGIAEELAERFVERAAEDPLAGNPVHHDQGIDIDRLGAPGVADAKIVHRVEGIRPDLNAGADFAEAVGLLQHRDAATFVGKPQRGRQPPDPASRDDGGCSKCLCRRHASLPCLSPSHGFVMASTAKHFIQYTVFLYTE